MVDIKILHIWNTAGVASVIAKYMDRLYGTESLVIHRRALDPYGVTTYGELWDCGPKEFTFRALLKARGFDIVHVHYFYRIVPYLRRLYSKKPIIMHFHGDDIRDKWNLMQRYWEKADLILYSTTDLKDDETPETALYVPNAVDTDIFHPFEVKPKHKTALHFSYNADDLAAIYAEKYGLELIIYNHERNGVMPYIKVPEFLSCYEYYVDAKRNQKGKLLSALSKTGLEALACGLNVIAWDGRLIRGLPEENQPHNVAERLFIAYEKLL